MSLSEKRNFYWPSKCEYCGTHLKYRNQQKNCRTTHTNIQQDPSHHFFCSKRCKANWCISVSQEGNKNG